MTPKDLIEQLLRENTELADAGDQGPFICKLNILLLEKLLQRLIDRTGYPVTNETIARMANLLQENERVASTARGLLESLYSKESI